MFKFWSCLVVLICLSLCAVFSTVLHAQGTVPGWRIHTPLPSAITGHASQLLPTGEILIAGGLDAQGAATTTSLIYDPKTGVISPTANTLAQSRAYFALVSVPSGGSARVFAIGGYSGSLNNYSSVASIEMLTYNAAVKSWSWQQVGSMSQSRGDLRACWDQNNSIVIGGGKSLAGGALNSGVVLASSEQYNLTSLTSTRIGDMTKARSEQFLGTIINDKGAWEVLTAGGEFPVNPTVTEKLVGANWSSNAGVPRNFHRAATTIVDLSGTARVFGGYDDAGQPSSVCEWFDVKAGWRPAPPMNSARAEARVTTVAGLVDTVASCLVVAGLRQGGGDQRSTEIFNFPSSNDPAGSWLAGYDLNQTGYNRTVTIGGNNLPLVVGGATGSSAIGTTEVFQPLAANNANFGGVEVGRLSDSLPVQIKNVWLLPVRISKFQIASGSEFILAGDTSNVIIPPGGAGTVYVYFRPSALGSRQSKLFLNIGAVQDTLLLTGTGLTSHIAVQTAGINFYGVLLGDTKTLCFGAIKNNGTDTTVVDSIGVSSGGEFSIVSPIGKTRLAPDSVLQVCVSFHPTKRGQYPAFAKCHLGSRTYTIDVSGIGMRRFLTAQSNLNCDTVGYVSGAQFTTTITVTNPGDTTVLLDSIGLVGAAASEFKVLSPTSFPIVLLPGSAATLVTIQYTPINEGSAQITAQLLNNGDSLANAPICFVSRAHGITLSKNSIDLGVVCLGDTARADVLIENPSLYDKLQIGTISVDKNTPDLQVITTAPLQLNPLSRTPITLQFSPSAAGALAVNIVASSTFGQIKIPVTAHAVPRITYAPQSLTDVATSSVIIPVSVQGNIGTGGILSSTLNFDYDRTMLFPQSIVAISGGVAIDPTSSIVYNQGGSTRLSVKYLAPLTAPGPAFGIVCTVLLGDNNRTGLHLWGQDTNYCLSQSDATLSIAADCQGQSGLLGHTTAAYLTINSISPGGTMSVSVGTREDGNVSISLYDISGSRRQTWDLGWAAKGAKSVKLNTSFVARGMYYLRASLNGSAIAHQKVVIQ